MKTDREFLDGIYQKAKLMEENKNEKVKITYFTPHKKALVAAAAFILVAIPSIINLNQPQMKTPTNYKSDKPMAIRSFNVLDVETLITNSDLILTGKVTKIEKNVYEEDKSRIITTVKVKPTEILKGKAETNMLDIKINGGYNEKTKSFIEYDTTFKRYEDVLVFLEHDADSNSYIVSGSSQGKYTYLNSLNDVKNYIGADDVTITISDLKEKISQGE